MIAALIVDDEPPARARLRQLLQDAGDVLVVAEAGDAEEARAAIDRVHPDVVFLDIEMPLVRGTDFAASLPAPRPFIVFTTAYDRFALDAFALDATDYLLKPVTRARLGGTLDRVRARLASRSDLDREISTASELQARMLGRPLPSVDGLDCAGLSEPARGVGGDFFDVFPLGAGRIAFVLGDVAGKGIPAGLVASSIQGRVHTAARQAGDPCAMLASISDDVHALGQGARYATLVFGEMDSATGRLLLVNAGHPAALVLHPRGRREWLAATGPAIGMLDAARYTMHETTLAAGSMLMSVSDGILEAFDEAGTEFGDDRLLTIAREVTSGPAARACETIAAAARAHRGSLPASDDATVLVIIRTGPGS